MLSSPGAGVPMTSPQLYSAGHTDDIRVAVMYIAKKYPRARLLGIGFSLGANVLTRYLAEEGEHSRLIAGCALACVGFQSKLIYHAPESVFSVAMGSPQE